MKKIDKNVSFSHSLSQLQHICVGFRLDPIAQISTTQLTEAGLAEESRDAWTLHSSPPKADVQLKLDLGASRRVGTLWTHCHEFCGGFFSHHRTEDKVLHILDPQ